VNRLKAAIKAGEYSMEQVNADIVEMDLSEEGAAVLISCLEE